MKYLEKNDNYRIRITVESGNLSVTDSEVIKKELIHKSDRIEPCYKSSRSMWPNQELIGVSISESDKFSGKIMEEKFKLSIDNYKDFENVYRQLEKWLTGTKIDLPRKESFRVTGFTFVSTADDMVVVYDSSKSENRDQLFGCIYESENVKSNYSMIQGMVTFSIINPKEGLSLDEFENYVNSIISQKIIIVGPRDDMIDSED
jgi:hypothetical protein